MNDKAFRRKNHYVPQFLLKRFSAKANPGRVWEYRLLVEDARVPEWELRPVSQLARTSDLYTIAESEEESDRIERWLDEDFENPARDAVAKVTSGGRLNATQWKQLIRLYAAQFVRTPAYFIRHKDQWAREMQTILKDAHDRLLPELPKYRDIESDSLVIEGERWVSIEIHDPTTRRTQT